MIGDSLPRRRGKIDTVYGTYEDFVALMTFKKTTNRSLEVAHADNRVSRDERDERFVSNTTSTWTMLMKDCETSNDETSASR